MRRLFVPLGIVVLAVALGVAFLAPSRPTARATSLAANYLADSTTSNTAAQLALGKTLFDETCSTCHGIRAQGGALAPNLRGVGAATVDLWVSSGWMPLANPTTQPIKKPALFDRNQSLAIAYYVASLTPGLGTPIPMVDLKHANLSNGFSVFALNCAPCHTITGAGDALSNGITAPTLHGVTATEIAEAVRTGPGNMPRFAATAISSSQLTDLIYYVKHDIQHLPSPGGVALGGIGPVAEGFIGLFVGVGVCLLLALWIGDRTEPDEQEPNHDEPSEPEVDVHV